MNDFYGFGGFTGEHFYSFLAKLAGQYSYCKHMGKTLQMWKWFVNIVYKTVCLLEQWYFL